ncbi:MAG TPA: putative glycolipid-binding domain-containing protein [Niastella sp.]
MQTNILWTGREYYSLENCLINESVSGVEISSIIIGHYEEKIYNVEYHIKTNTHWETIFFEIISRHSNQTQAISYESDGKGNWTKAGQPLVLFNGCIDIDIPLTPFTNTLPIRRLKLQPHQTREIQVLYCDLLQLQIMPVHQKYTCVSATEYHYENIPNDFEANIQVDGSGFVVDYPSLFVRRAALETHYQ